MSLLKKMDTKITAKTNKNIASPLLGLDMFKARLNMQFDNGKTEIGTCIGATLTVALVILIVVFAGQKFNVVSAHSNAVITTAELLNFYSSNNTFGADQGLNMAVAAIGYGAAFSNPSLGGRLDPTYAEIKAVAYSWTVEAEKFTPVKTHPCSQEELGLDGNSNSQFMTVNAEELDLVLR